MMPDNISTYGHLIDRVLLIIFVGGAAVTIFSFLFVFYTLFKFHHSRNRTSSRNIGKISRLVYLVGFMIFFDFIIALFSGEAWSEVFLKSSQTLLAEENNDHLPVKIIGRQFFWSFVYPGPDNKFDTNDDFTTGNIMVVPVNKLILMDITSGDVIHSFFAPNLRFKYDAIPGRNIKAWFKATKTGTYEIFCAELCGAQHYMMRSTLKIVDDDEFKAWQKNFMPN